MIEVFIDHFKSFKPILSLIDFAITGHLKLVIKHFKLKRTIIYNQDVKIVMLIDLYVKLHLPFRWVTFLFFAILFRQRFVGSLLVNFEAFHIVWEFIYFIEFLRVDSFRFTWYWYSHLLKASSWAYMFFFTFFTVWSRSRIRVICLIFL